MRGIAEEEAMRRITSASQDNDRRIAELEHEFYVLRWRELSDENKALKRENAEFRAAQTWRPIETAPRDGTWIHACGRGLSIASYPATIFWDDGWQAVGDSTSSFEATHWRPLPPPPDASAAIEEATKK